MQSPNVNRESPQTETHWRAPVELVGNAEPPEPLRGWLLEAGSLTRRLRDRFGGRVSMTLTDQRTERPLLEEAALLGMGVHDSALVRRIVLRVDGEPVVHGRAVIPPATLRGEGEVLAALEERPLGEVAFAELEATRRDLTLARLAPGSTMFPHLDEPVWARRSVLDPTVGPVLVTEAFLPALLEL